MSTDSPVLNALERNPDIDLVYCKRCGKEGHLARWRWTRYGQNGFCSNKCWREVKAEFREELK